MAAKDITKEYSDGEITIVWKPGICAHSERCWNKEKGGLPSVFDPDSRPWIDPEGADNDAIMQHIKRCPSGALSYYSNDKTEDKSAQDTDAPSITVAANGPLMVKGPVVIEKLDGTTQQMDKTALCRCGASSNKPFCDGSHHKIDFQDA